MNSCAISRFLSGKRIYQRRYVHIPINRLRNGNSELFQKRHPLLLAFRKFICGSFACSPDTNDRRTVTIKFIVINPDDLPDVGKEWDGIEDRKYFDVQCCVDDRLVFVVGKNINLLKYGICDGNLNCGTCSLIFKPEHATMLPEADLGEIRVNTTIVKARESQRLACQLKVYDWMDGITVIVPKVLATAIKNGKDINDQNYKP